jgi:uncharacterized ion transporter superfamily protein YfcC
MNEKTPETVSKKSLTRLLMKEPPHTYLLIFIILIICAVLTYIIPAGQFNTEVNEAGRSILIPGTYHHVESNPVSLYNFFNAIPTGLTTMSSLIFFVMIAGGSFAVINSTKTIDILINKLVRALKGKEHWVICAVMLLMSLLGGLIGFDAECVIFVPICVSLARRMGYDSIVGMAMVVCGAFVGSSVGTFNPYATAVAQGIAGLPIFSGAWYRVIMHVVILIAAASYTTYYGEKVRKEPAKSYCYGLEQTLPRPNEDKDLEESLNTRFSTRNILVLVTMLLGFGTIIYGAIHLGWFAAQMAPIFLAMGIISGIMGGINGNQICRTWIEGARSMMFACLVIGLGRAILVVMENGMIFHTILNAMAGVLETLPTSFIAIGMFLMNILINFFVPSGSGMAALVMPIMAPLAMMTGVTAQTAVIAFQCAAGFSDIIIPTSSTTNACIGAANINFVDWIKFSIRLAMIEWGLSIVFIVIANIIQLQ